MVESPARFQKSGPRALPFQLNIATYGADQIEVVSFRGRESLSRGYRFDILGRATGVDVGEFEQTVLQQNACLLIHDAVVPRLIRGIVASVSLDRLDTQDRLAFRVRLVPRSWLLNKVGNPCHRATRVDVPRSRIAELG